MSKHVLALSFGVLSMLRPGISWGQECSLRSCDTSKDGNMERFLRLNAEADKECFDVLQNSISHGREQEIRETYAKLLGRDTSCDQPFVLLRGAMDASVYVSKGGKGLFGQEHALSILPTFAVAIPVRLEARSPASEAISGGATMGGLAIRYTPVSYWAGVSVALGVTEPSAVRLDREVFKAPKMLTFGGSLTVLGNLLSVGVFRAWLYTEGYMSTLGSSTTYLNIQFDVSALGLAALGATK